MTGALERSHTDLLDLATRALHWMEEEKWSADPAVVFWVPGRVEFLGKHTDYAGGRSLLCAIERGICVMGQPRRDNVVRVCDARSRQLLNGVLDPETPPVRDSWLVYPSTVIHRLATNFPDARIGADIAFASDLPMAAGISSSSALVVSVALVLTAINRLSEVPRYTRNITDDADLAEYFGCIEGGYDFRVLRGDRGVGTLSGCEDQTAMLCAKPDALVQYSFCPVRYEDSAPLPIGHRFAIGVSGVAAEKTASALGRYNALSRKAAAVAAAWREASGRTQDRTIADAVRASGANAVRSSLTQTTDGFSADALRDRFDQFHLESETLIPRVTAALRQGALPDVGQLVDQSQAGAERWLGNQIPETKELVRSARSLGAAAASAFGAGFGGSVWALLNDTDQAFLERWRNRYFDAFPGRSGSAVFFITRAGPPATRLA